mmetsp:Transcript_6083/g.14629  ORF Transcript_6083/g.14629 Transcript_6083/m.14629 type:complete len:96 (+) Transcript_6083:251-538(+)
MCVCGSGENDEVDANHPDVCMAGLFRDDLFGVAAGMSTLNEGSRVIRAELAFELVRRASRQGTAERGRVLIHFPLGALSVDLTAARHTRLCVCQK